MLGLSLRLIDKSIADGSLVVKRIGRRILVPHTSVERFIQAPDREQTTMLGGRD